MAISMRRGVRHLGAALHGELGGFGELALEGADDQKSHAQFLCRVAEPEDRVR